MGTAIITALIVGVFTLVAVWFKHRLENPPANEEYYDPTRARKRITGYLVFIAIIVALVIAWVAL